MRSFLMVTAFSAILLLALDAYKFEGRYREELWRDMKEYGRNIAFQTEHVVRKALHR